MYKTPTFIIHPGRDDFVPVEQSQRTYEALTAVGVKAELRVIADLSHLFDAYRGWSKDEQAWNSVLEGYQFLCDCVGLHQ